MSRDRPFLIVSPITLHRCAALAATVLPIQRAGVHLSTAALTRQDRAEAGNKPLSGVRPGGLH